MTEPLLPILKVRKKPVQVEAVHYVDVDMREGIITWINTLRDGRAGQARYVGESIRIPTLEGNLDAPLGWYIIRGVEGEFYPCDPNIFMKTYELATEDD